MQCIGLRLAGDSSHNGITHDAAAAVDHVDGGIGVDALHELARLAAGIEVHVLIGGTALGQHILGVRDSRLVAVQRKGIAK